MQVMTLQSWTEMKSLVSTKQLLLQFVENAGSYELAASEGQSFIWSYSMSKENTSEILDFETNFKAKANAPLENKAGVGRPERVAASPQPNNTVEHWKGYQITLEQGQTTAYVDIEFSTDVYLKGGRIISLDVDGDDYISVEARVRANDAIYLPGLIETAYMLPNVALSFLSEECMLFPSILKLRINLTCPAADKGITANVLVDFFK
jgi:hypothetical protein